MSRARGEVLVRVLVGPNGKAENVRISESSGNDIIDKAAIDAANKSTFAPATKDGVRVRFWLILRYDVK